LWWWPIYDDNDDDSGGVGGSGGGVGGGGVGGGGGGDDGGGGGVWLREQRIRDFGGTPSRMPLQLPVRRISARHHGVWRSASAHRGVARWRDVTHPQIDVAVVLAAMVLVLVGINFGSRLADAATALSMKTDRIDEASGAKHAWALGLESIGMRALPGLFYPIVKLWCTTVM
jgi:hypothetical protein